MITLHGAMKRLSQIGALDNCENKEKITKMLMDELDNKKQTSVTNMSALFFYLNRVHTKSAHVHRSVVWLTKLLRLRTVLFVSHRPGILHYRSTRTETHTRNWH